MRQSMKVLTSSNTSDWYTPPWCISLVVKVLDDIELDPASSEMANRYVKAKRFFSLPDDSLMLNWQASTVFLNPPYGKRGNLSQAGLFLNKLNQHYMAGDVTEAIALVDAKWGYDWFTKFVHKRPFCIPDKRIRFLFGGLPFEDHEIRSDGQAKHASCFFYFGTDLERFYDVFSEIGYIGCTAESKPIPFDPFED